MKPQTRLVLSLLRSEPDGITSLEALYAGCGSRLAARVIELRREGFDVETTWFTTPGGARVARYRLHEEPTQLELGVAS